MAAALAGNDPGSLAAVQARLDEYLASPMNQPDPERAALLAALGMGRE